MHVFGMFRENIIWPAKSGVGSFLREVYEKSSIKMICAKILS